MHSRRRRARGASAPPAPARLTREPYIENIAAQQLSATFRVVWQCEVDFRWQCWADYSGEHARILEAAWDFMTPQVQLAASASYGEYDLWLVCFASFLHLRDPILSVLSLLKTNTVHGEYEFVMMRKSSHMRPAGPPLVRGHTHYNVHMRTYR